MVGGGTRCLETDQSAAALAGDSIHQPRGNVVREMVRHQQFNDASRGPRTAIPAGEGIAVPEGRGTSPDFAVSQGQCCVRDGKQLLGFISRVNHKQRGIAGSLLLLTRATERGQRGRGRIEYRVQGVPPFTEGQQNTRFAPPHGVFGSGRKSVTCRSVIIEHRHRSGSVTRRVHTRRHHCEGSGPSGCLEMAGVKAKILSRGGYRERARPAVVVGQVHRPEQPTPAATRTSEST